ncbi:MAG: hypothetical protein ABIO86_05765 [Sphingomonas sp.]
MAISKRDLTHIGFDSRHDSDTSAEKGDPNMKGRATETAARPIFSAGPRGRDRTGIAPRAAGATRHPISHHRSVHDQAMTPPQDAGSFVLAETEIGRSAPLKAEWL